MKRIWTAALAAFALLASPTVASDRLPLVIINGQTKQMPAGDTVPVANGGTGATTASAARTSLGLGTLATQSGTFSGTSSGTNTGDQFTSTTASKLIGRGSASGAGAAQEISVANGLAISGTTLNGPSQAFCVAVSDESTAITTGTAKVTFRMPYAFTLTAVRASVNTVSSSGNPTFDLKEAGVSIFSTTLSIDTSEKTSQTAATAAVISDSSLADDAEMTIDITTAGTGAKGAKLCLIGHQ